MLCNQQCDPGMLESLLCLQEKLHSSELSLEQAGESFGQAAVDTYFHLNTHEDN